MSKPKNLLSAAASIPEDVMEAARKKVQMEQAELLARQEAGIEVAEPETEIEKPKGKVKRGPTIKNEEQVPVLIDLAPYCDRITLDGVVYMHGRSYTVPKSKFDSINEICSRTWGHQAEIDGKPTNFYRKGNNARLSGRQYEGVTA